MEAVRKSVQAVLILLSIVAVGVAGFIIIEDYTFIQAIWMTIITITTVGFGVVKPLSVPGQIFTILLIITGAGSVAYAFGTLIGIVMEGHLKNAVGRKSMEKKIANLNNHVIICGAGRVGSEVIQRLTEEKVPFVVIDHHQEAIEELWEKGFLAIHGDATEDELLIQAGICRARGIISALSGDANNVFVTLTAKGLNPSITVVARAERIESEEKLRRAGASKVIAPSVIGGRQMASFILRPVSVDFFESVIYAKGLEMEFEEILVEETSSLCNATMQSSQIKQKSGAMVVAILRDEKFITNPDITELILPNDLLLVLGTRFQLDVLEDMAGGRN
ncbi:MAG TPA: NAD-binding protein [Bacillota bacterium]|nr:NAD-binding protein [Bacillota bacterium]